VRVQSGFVLFELLLAAAVVLLIMIWGSQSIAARINDAAARDSARWMLMVRNAMHKYLEQHHDLIRQATAPDDLLLPGFQDWTSPTVAELRTSGLLSPGFPESIRPLQGATIRVLRDGACPGDACRIGAIVHGRQAFQKAPGVADEQMMAQWLLAADGRGGIVHPSRPGLISGRTFELANPPDGGPAVGPGSVVMAVSSDELTDAAWLRVGDTRDPRFQSDVTLQGAVSAGGSVSAGTWLRAGAIASWRNHCEPEGAIAQDVDHGLMMCRNNIWQSASGSAGGFMENSYYGCSTSDGLSTANPVTGSCSCPTGHNVVQVSESRSDTWGTSRGFICIR